MIISGGSRSNWRFFAGHLTNALDNEHVTVAEMRGLIAQDVREALREMDAIAGGTKCKNTFYHADINPRADEHLTAEQWEVAVDTLERNLKLDGHARFVIEHSKEGREHRHVVWSRIDPETMTAVSDSHNYRAHERTSRELEALFGHEPVRGTLLRDTDIKRPDRRPDNWEVFRGKRSKIDPAEVTRDVTVLWNSADSGTAFAAALRESGYVLCKGDRRDYVLLDAAGDTHSLARRIDGVKAAGVRVRMADIDPDDILSLDEGKALIAERKHVEAALDTRTVEEPAAARGKNAPREAIDEYVTRLSGAQDVDPPAPVWTVEDIKDAVAAQRGKGQRASDRVTDYVAPINEALRQGENVPTRDGLGWFSRMQTAFAATVETVTEWARERFDSFVNMVRQQRDDGRDTLEPDDPDIGR